MSSISNLAESISDTVGKPLGHSNSSGSLCIIISASAGIRKCDGIVCVDGEKNQFKRSNPTALTLYSMYLGAVRKIRIVGHNKGEWYDWGERSRPFR